MQQKRDRSVCKPVWVLIALLAVAMPQMRALAADDPSARPSRVQDYGAVGNGTALDTVAIQKAIDACSNQGGGTVSFSPGVYLSGTIFLKDNVRLYFEPNAVLRGSARTEDYPPIARKNVRGDAAFPGGFLIYADGVHNASIEGRGAIDGQGPEFWFDEMLSPMVRKPKPARPRAMICIVKGDSLLFRDITLTNSPFFTLWLVGCDNVNVDGITIRNPRNGPNTDGIDLDCCRGVRIANCSIDGGDDAIALKSDSGMLMEDKACEDIAVSNCVLSSAPACAVRVGYEGDSVIRNCTFNNLTIHDTDIGLDIVSVLPDIPNATILKGTRCENIVFSNIVMRNVNRAIYFWMGNEKPGDSQIHLKNILVSNVVAQSQLGSYIGGSPAKRVEDVTLSNIRLILTGRMPEQAPLSGSGIWGGMNPYGLYCTWTDGMRISDLQVDFREASGAWRNAISCEESRDAKLSGIRTQGFAALPGQAVLGLKNTVATVRNCDAEPEVPVFIQAENGSQATVLGCDLKRAKVPFAADDTSTVNESPTKTTN